MRASYVELRRQQAALAGDEIAETAALLELAKLREAYRAAEAAHPVPNRGAAR